MALTSNQIYAVAGSGQTQINNFFEEAFNRNLLGSESGYVTPSGVFYDNYISPNAKCGRLSTQAPVNVDKESTREFFNIFMKELNKYDINSKGKDLIFENYLAIMTNALNIYFGGQVAQDGAYKDFTANGEKSLSNFKGSNKSSELERALLAHNTNKLLGINSSIIFNNNKVFVGCDDPFDRTAYTIFYPGCYIFFKDHLPATSMTSIDMSDKNTLLYGKEKNSITVGDFKDIERQIGVSNFYHDSNFEVDIYCLGLERKMSQTREK